MSSMRPPAILPLPSKVLERPVEGVNVAPGATMQDVLGFDRTLLVFLRHHG